MRFIKKHYILTLCLFLCLTALLFLAIDPLEPVVAEEQNLETAEIILQQLQDELASMLRSYYMGHAGEGETKRLIDKVEAQRLLVDKLREESTIND